MFLPFQLKLNELVTLILINGDGEGEDLSVSKGRYNSGFSMQSEEDVILVLRVGVIKKKCGCREFLSQWNGKSRDGATLWCEGA